MSLVYDKYDIIIGGVFTVDLLTAIFGLGVIGSALAGAAWVSIDPNDKPKKEFIKKAGTVFTAACGSAFVIAGVFDIDGKSFSEVPKSERKIKGKQFMVPHMQHVNLPSIDMVEDWTNLMLGYHPTGGHIINQAYVDRLDRMDLLDIVVQMNRITYYEEYVQLQDEFFLRTGKYLDYEQIFGRK